MHANHLLIVFVLFKYYVPSIAPSGLMYYSGNLFPAWKGSLFSGALKLTHINRIPSTGGPKTEERLLQQWKKRIRNIIQGPDNLIYFSTDAGEIFRFIPLKTR